LVLRTKTPLPLFFQARKQLLVGKRRKTQELSIIRQFLSLGAYKTGSNIVQPGEPLFLNQDIAI